MVVSPPSSPYRSTPFTFFVRKKQSSKGYQLNMGQQITIRLGTDAHVKTEQGHPVKGKVFQDHINESQTLSTHRTNKQIDK